MWLVALTLIILFNFNAHVSIKSVSLRGFMVFLGCLLKIAFSVLFPKNDKFCFFSREFLLCGKLQVLTKAQNFLLYKCQIPPFLRFVNFAIFQLEFFWKKSQIMLSLLFTYLIWFGFGDIFTGKAWCIWL